MKHKYIIRQNTKRFAARYILKKVNGAIVADAVPTDDDSEDADSTAFPFHKRPNQQEDKCCDDEERECHTQIRPIRKICRPQIYGVGTQNHCKHKECIQYGQNPYKNLFE
jgi:hypothetical protein